MSVRDDQSSKITGFESGADDYITKPFTFKELDLRMEVLLRRYNANILTLGNLKVLLDSAKVMVFDEEITLSVQEYRMLLLLMQNKEELVLRTLFHEELNIINEVQDNTLNVAMRRLRKKLSDVAVIEVVVKKGYRIHAL
ncbi:MAG: response regulator transcription factor [Erysipelothrix sp.]|nr:response regulator transcription factor [Erysipelothrix sp.]